MTVHYDLLLNRRIKSSQEILLSFKKESGRVRLGIKFLPRHLLHHYIATQLNSDLAQCVRRIPSSLFRVDEGSISLGEGSFGKCVKGYMQGFEVCLNKLKAHQESLQRYLCCVKLQFCRTCAIRLYAFCMVYSVKKSHAT